VCSTSVCRARYCDARDRACASRGGRDSVRCCPAGMTRALSQPCGGRSCAGMAGPLGERNLNVGSNGRSMICVGFSCDGTLVAGGCTERLLSVSDSSRPHLGPLAQVPPRCLSTRVQCLCAATGGFPSFLGSCGRVLYSVSFFQRPSQRRALFLLALFRCVFPTRPYGADCVHVRTVFTVTVSDVRGRHRGRCWAWCHAVASAPAGAGGLRVAHVPHPAR
jgi:hypothetical protein